MKPALLCLLLCGCAVDLQESAQLRLQVHEMERQLEQQQMWNAGCSDDNSELQSEVIRLQQLMRDQQRMDIELAKECAAARESCET